MTCNHDKFNKIVLFSDNWNKQFSFFMLQSLKPSGVDANYDIIAVAYVSLNDLQLWFIQ